VVAAHYKTDDLLNCWTSSSDISGYHADFHEVTALSEQGRGAACYVWIGLIRARLSVLGRQLKRLKQSCACAPYTGLRRSMLFLLMVYI